MARGSQNKDPLLVVTAGLAVALLVTAYYFIDQVDRLTQTRDRARDNERAFRTQERTSKDRFEQLAEITLGPVGEDPNPDETLKQVAAQLNPSLGEGRGPRKKNYESVLDAVEFLETELAAADRYRDSLKASIGELQAAKAQSTQRGEIMVAEAKKFLEATVAEAQKEIAKLDEFIAKLDQQINDANVKFGTVNTELEQARRDMASEKDKYTRQISSARQLLAQLERGERIKGQQQFEQPDGQLSFVFQGGREAYIDLGTQDGAFPGLTFSVYSQSTGGSPYVAPKASVEIVRVDDARRSLVRLAGTSIEEPVIPGDLIYNPIWSARKRARIVFVGLFQLDDELEGSLRGKEKFVQENGRFEALVLRNGGQIDARFDFDRREATGEVTKDTAWLVIGSIPEDASAADAVSEWIMPLRQARNSLEVQAKAHGVRVIDYRNFLAFLGYVSRNRLVPGGLEDRYLVPRPKPALAPPPGQSPQPSSGQSSVSP